MGRALLLIAVVLTGIGFLFVFAPTFNLFNSIDTSLIASVTDNTTSYTTSTGTVANFNDFEYIIMHNLAYIFFIGAAICIIIGLGKMSSG